MTISFEVIDVLKCQQQVLMVVRFSPFASAKKCPCIKINLVYIKKNVLGTTFWSKFDRNLIDGSVLINIQIINLKVGSKVLAKIHDSSFSDLIQIIFFNSAFFKSDFLPSQFPTNHPTIMFSVPNKIFYLFLH